MQAGSLFSTESKQFAYEHKETVHHNNSACIEGGKIAKSNLELGTGSRPLCKECARLNASLARMCEG